MLRETPRQKGEEVSFPALISASLAMRAARKAKRKLKAKRIAKVRKPTHAQLVKKADILFGAAVRAAGICESGRDKHAGPLQCAHGFSRRYHGTRWELRNAFSLCAGCHVFFTHRPIEWDEWMRGRMGAERYEALRSLALLGRPDMERVLAELGA